MVEEHSKNLARLQQAHTEEISKHIQKEEALVRDMHARTMEVEDLTSTLEKIRGHVEAEKISAPVLKRVVTERSESFEG